MTNFQETPVKQYILAKFQPGNILLMNRYTKQAFNYFQVKNSQLLSQQLNHPYLLRPLFYGTGLLYPEGQSNLRIELQNRRRAYQKQYFGEDELVNTFCPLFQCLEHLHKNKIVHGQIHPQNVVLLDGQIKMRDWLVQFQENPFYSSQKRQNKTQADDLIALGQILAQLSTLKKSNDPFEDKDVEAAVESIIGTYSKSFIFSIIILLKRKTELFKNLLALLKSKDSGILFNSQLNDLYEKIKLSKESKIIKSQPVQKIPNTLQTTHKKENIFVQFSPNKKLNINQTNKKTSYKLDDTENKKIFNEQVKKRQIQKITKIIERSNAFVNELMARKNNNDFGGSKSNSEHVGVKKTSQVINQQVLKRITGKNNLNLAVTISNIPMYGVEPTKKVKQANLFAFSPNKRLRTISRKK